MWVIIAVIKDLWAFIRAHDSLPTPLEITLPSTLVWLKELPGPEEHKLIGATIAPPLIASQVRVMLPLPRKLDEGFVYAIVSSLTVHHEPVVAFDNVICSVLYGVHMEVGRQVGRWTEVHYLSNRGWVLTEGIGTAQEVFPHFSLGKFYEAEDTETVKLRTLIADSFAGATSKTVLTGVEYVSYRLRQQGLVIPWPINYARIAGSWQRKLRGIKGVKIDIMPRTGSIIEYIIDDVGYVGYVEAVSPDLKITVLGVGLVHDAQYTEQVLPHAVWRELHPVFIQVV